VDGYSCWNKGLAYRNRPDATPPNSAFQSSEVILLRQKHYSGQGSAEGGCGFPINDFGTSLRSGRGVGGDDAADCLRYLVATKSRAVMRRKLRGV